MNVECNNYDTNESERSQATVILHNITLSEPFIQSRTIYTRARIMSLIFLEI